MALVKCPECGKEISSTVNRCVNCGHRKGFSTKDKARIVAACLLQIIAIVLLITCCYIYTFEGHYYNYYNSEFGFDYSGYLVHSDDCFGNIFLKQNTSLNPEISVTSAVTFFSYVVIGTGFFGIAVYLCVLLQEKYLKNSWLIPGITVGLLLIHSIVVSASTLEMIGTQGYYEVKPSVFWFLVVFLEILATVLGKKSANKSTRSNMIKSQVVMKDTESCYVDAHGILRDHESEIAIQDIQP